MIKIFLNLTNLLKFKSFIKEFFLMNNEIKDQKLFFKIIVCGTGGVGKTSLIRRYVENKFEENYLMTLGMDPTNTAVEIDVGGKTIVVNLIIYDVAGQDRFQSLREVFFRGAHGALLVFDLTRPETLDELEKWYRDLYDRAGPVPTILIGNKADLEDEINIDYQTIEDVVIPKFKVIKYLETSCYLDKNVYQSFHDLVHSILVQRKLI
jgi:small GTP-binding protein